MSGILQPFPKGVKFLKALGWWLSAGWRTYDKQGKLKYCDKCGWPVYYFADLYDAPVEAYSPDVIAECSSCGTEYIECESFIGRKSVLPKID